ncbi:MAG: hypothetical protein P9M14_00710 [Candidatus Alcyoniella australis]|nr:hypothetical protein [Candidatus Alcyoniella australis]
MADDVFIVHEEAQTAEVKFCPLIQRDCRQDACQWWTIDYQEDKGKYRMNCAIALIAKGVTEESLSKLKGGSFKL